MLKMTNYPQTILDYKSPTHMPYGASYVLPIILGCLLHSESGYKKVIIENPEAHLHPSAQSKLGKFLAKMAYAGVQIIIETHHKRYKNSYQKYLTLFQKEKNWVKRFPLMKMVV